MAPRVLQNARSTRSRSRIFSALSVPRAVVDLHLSCTWPLRPSLTKPPLSPLEIGDDLDRIHSQSTSDIKELDHIQPPFAALEL